MPVIRAEVRLGCVARPGEALGERERDATCLAVVPRGHDRLKLLPKLLDGFEACSYCHYVLDVAVELVYARDALGEVLQREGDATNAPWSRSACVVGGQER